MAEADERAQEARNDAEASPIKYKTTACMHDDELIGVLNTQAKWPHCRPRHGDELIGLIGVLNTQAEWPNIGPRHACMALK